MEQNVTIIIAIKSKESLSVSRWPAHDYWHVWPESEQNKTIGCIDKALINVIVNNFDLVLKPRWQNYFCNKSCVID